MVHRLLAASGIREIFDRAQALKRQGKKILHLDVGRPDWPAPPGAEEGVKKAMDEHFHHYIENRGLLDLRLEVAKQIQEKSDRSFDPEEELIMTVGASEGIAMATLALCGPGDEVIIPEPAWSHYEVNTALAGATSVPLALKREEGFQINIDDLKKLITPKTKFMFLNTPSNPIGVVQNEEVLKEVAALSEKHGFYVMSDEVYDHFVYEKPHISIAKFMQDSDRLVYINSFSKTYSMTGWRIGMIAAEKKIADALNRVHQHLTVCGVSYAQKAAIEVMKHPERKSFVEEMKQAFAKRGQVWTEVLGGHEKFQFVKPEGAFYLFPKIEYQGMSAREICYHFLDEYGISMVPGEIFGKAYAQHVRISFGGSEETQREAAEKIKSVL